MAVDLGKVGMVDKGAYNSGSTYEAMDVVTFNSATYIAIQDVPVNTAPTNTSYWREAFSNAIIGTSDISDVALTITSAINKLGKYDGNLWAVAAPLTLYDNGVLITPCLCNIPHFGKTVSFGSFIVTESNGIQHELKDVVYVGASSDIQVIVHIPGDYRNCWVYCVAVLS